MDTNSLSKTSSFPEGAVQKVVGNCIVLRGDDIDTDRIIPARFLKCVNFETLGDKVFADDRNEIKGFHPFDLRVNQGASILVVNDNFGCGSSREHAPQALMRWGIRAIVGQSFAEIFYGNCLALGIPCATTSFSIITQIQNFCEKNPNKNFTLNLREKILDCEEKYWSLILEEGPLEMLLTGTWDATYQLIAQEKELMKTTKRLPYLNNFITEV